MTADHSDELMTAYLGSWWEKGNPGLASMVYLIGLHQCAWLYNLDMKQLNLPWNTYQCHPVMK